MGKLYRVRGRCAWRVGETVLRREEKIEAEGEESVLELLFSQQIVAVSE
jgi:hypothetical protein